MHNTSLSIAASVVILFVAFLVWTQYDKADTKESPVATQQTAVEAYGDTNALGQLTATNKTNLPVKTNNNTKIMNATFETNKGNITIELFADRVPNTVANFTKLAGEGFYNGVKFHRVIKGFMIQGGDPLTKDDTMVSRWGTGGPGYKFDDEITAENKNDIGTIAMANAGPNTNGSQFFFNVNDNNFLDGKHTVFGRVTSGMDIVKEIEAVPTDGSDRPLEPVVIKAIVLK